MLRDLVSVVESSVSPSPARRHGRAAIPVHSLTSESSASDIKEITGKLSVTYSLR